MNSNSEVLRKQMNILTIIQWSPSLCIHYNACAAFGHKPALSLNNNPSNQDAFLISTLIVHGCLVCPDKRGSTVHTWIKVYVLFM